MKNLLFSVFALVILALATSCQKEEILPQSTPSTALYGQAIGPGSSQGNPAAAATTTVGNNNPTWENWDFCGKPFVASKQQLPSKRWVLTIYDQGMNPNFYATGVEYGQLPGKVQQSLETSFPGETPMAQWQRVQPDDGTYFIEIDKGSYVVIVWMDAAGNLICKGTHP